MPDVTASYATLFDFIGFFGHLISSKKLTINDNIQYRVEFSFPLNDPQNNDSICIYFPVP